MAPKKGNQKMSIGDFLNDQSLGSWADEMDGQPMPAPSAGFGSDRRAFSSASGFGAARDAPGGGFGDRGLPDRPRPFREELPLPTRPPFTAHLGNLSFEVTQADVEDFLAGCEVTSVRLVEDKIDRRPKGFGYVEFATVDGLKKALERSETQFQGRNIRISIAEPQKDRLDRPDARELSDWSRKGPLPDLPNQGARRASERVGSFRGGMDAASDAGSDRGGRRGFFEGDAAKSRDFSNWERRGPLSPTPGQEVRPGGRGSRGPAVERRPSPAWGEAREGRPDSGSRPPRPERVPTAAETDTQWRSKMRPDAPSPAPTPEASSPLSPGPPSATAPASRPRLNLAKRTVSEAPQAESGAGGSSIFGGARPVDTATREAEVEKRHQESLRAKKEADDKAREEKKAREAAAKAEKAAAAATATPEGQEPTDSAAPTPRANGRPSVSKGADEETTTSAPAPGMQYEILRRMNSDGEADQDAPDAPANGEIVQDKEVKPQEIVREVPVDKASNGGGSWRKSPAATPTDASTAETLQDDGFNVVEAKRKKNFNRGPRGSRGGDRALAS